MTSSETQGLLAGTTRYFRAKVYFKSWGARNYYSSIFSADLSNVYRKVLSLMYAISTLLLLLAGKASRVPKVTSYVSSIVETLHDMQIAVARATQLCRPNARTIG